MKLRLQSNSIRLRLKRAEVANLVKIGSIEEKIVLGAGSDHTFSYMLESSSTVQSTQARLTKNGIVVQVPAKRVTEWAMGDDVGIEASAPAGEQRLQILIEKDFACLNGPPEQNLDTFPNPLEGTKC
jgi:hypothetical protein